MLSVYTKWLYENPDNQKTKLPKSFLYLPAEDREQQGQEVVIHLPDIRPKTGILLEYLQIDKESSLSSFVTVSPVS